MDWLSLSLLSALSLASADACSKKFLGQYSAPEMVLVRFAYSALLLAPLLYFNPLPAVPLAFWGWLALALPLEIIAMLLYMQAIRDAPLSLTMPYLAFTPVFTTLMGYLLLDEQVSVQGLIGIILAVGGAYLLNLEAVGRRGWRGGFKPLRAILSNRGSRMMLAVAIIYGVTSVIGKIELQYAPPLSFAALYFVLLGLLSLTLFALTKPRTLHVFGRKLLIHLLIAGLFTAMIVTHFMALERVETAYMISVKRTSILFGVLYGALLFGEQNLLRHLAAGALMVAGVALIAV
ncbi:MAG: DMT family transporter [Nitrococcus sp.]|nr:DMT family transporter [Nitrococcus sp.]